MNAEPVFHVHFDGEFQGAYCLSELVECNAEGAPDLCEWMRNAKICELRIEGGGASPRVVTQRVA